MHVASWIWVLIPITAIVCGIFAGVAKRWIRLKEREMKLSSEMTAEKAAQYAAHTERLEQRVRVLERIATDKGIDLADEIERLRDDRPH
jgi:ABC-type phosphate transport system auxiliary subunit